MLEVFKRILLHALNTRISIKTGINKGTAVYLNILKALLDPSKESRPVGFYHRNTSDDRKEEILNDLKLPLNSVDKKLQCVVATVSLGKFQQQQQQMALF